MALQHLQFEGVLQGAAHLVGHNRFEVGVGELDLAVGEFLEARERRVQSVAGDVEAEAAQPIREGVPARVLAQHDLAALLADRMGIHDLVGGALAEHAVLVDTGFVGKGVAPHDRLVVLHGVAGETADQGDSSCGVPWS